MADVDALTCHGITVTYGDVTALDNVSVSFEPGLVHAVVGQNGAGKTTFARVAAGLVKPDTGRISLNGEDLPPGRVNEARAAGVELVHQSFALPPSFTIAEAMEFGSMGKGAAYTRRGLEQRWKEHLQGLGVSAPPHARIRELPIEVQQSVEIARALVKDAKVLILDEPTAVLSPAGAENLFERVRMLKARGVTVILILHKIREVLAVADTVTVLRGGKLVEGPVVITNVRSTELARMIIGPESEALLGKKDRAALTGESGVLHGLSESVRNESSPLLEASAIATRDEGEGPPLDNVSLRILEGEIVGIAGVEGNGQRVLVSALAALTDLQQGSVTLGGVDVTSLDLATRRAAGLRVIPFERNVEGLSLTSSLWENWSARDLLQMSIFAPIVPRRLRRACDTALKAWSVHYSHVTQTAGSLSGGNAQKVILAREVDDDAVVIIAAQPTRGLDVGATTFVWDALRRARERGCGVLLVSSDLDELFDVCDRLLVMYGGQIAAEFEAPFDLNLVGAAMTGAAA